MLWRNQSVRLVKSSCFFVYPGVYTASKRLILTALTASSHVRPQFSDERYYLAFLVSKEPALLCNHLKGNTPRRGKCVLGRMAAKMGKTSIERGARQVYTRNYSARQIRDGNGQ